jgi:two-component system chemotaxis sensor kinase CheA
MNADDLEIALVFISEARELLDEVEPRLIELRQAAGEGGADPNTVNAIFRLFHSMKGSASSLGFSHVATVTHNAETLLDVYRKGTAVLGPEQTVVLLRAMDFVRKMLDAVESSHSDEGMEAEEREVIEELARAHALAKGKRTAAGPAAPPASDPPASDPPASDPPVKPVGPAFAPAPQASEGAPAPALPSAAPAEESLPISADMLKHFSSEGEELMGRCEQALLELEKSPVNASELIAEAFRAMHSFKGNCGFVEQNALGRLAHKAENVLEALKAGLLSASPSTVGLLLKAVDALGEGVAEVSRSGAAEGREFEAIGQMLEQSAHPANNAALAGVQSHAPDAPSPGSEQRAPEKDANGHGAKAPTRQDIRVDLTKLDALVNLVGELVIAEAMVTRHPSLRNFEDETLERAVHQLRRVSTDLQDVAMAVRMIPLSATFRKLIRLVHDLSNKVGKLVRLELVGEETEVDKSLIEQLSDPLVHLVRNSIDHGLEMPADRRGKGKPETGTITIEARHEGGEVLILISDDGRGLDCAKILDKAMERGLVQAGEAEKLTEAQVYKLIFEPGFSTAEKVTDISGRGVGMDVVKKNIEKIKGIVELRSKAGAGTTVVLHIPLTLAIIDGMLVRVGDARYTLPLLSIRESFRPQPEQITVTPDGQEVARVRREMLPVVRLHQLYAKKPDHEKLEEGILVIVESAAQTVCLFVDELMGQQQTVIKGLSSYLGQARGVSGCTILGDGEVSLILDVGSLIAMASQSTGSSLSAFL